MSKAVNNMSMGVVEPQERMKHLSHCGNFIDVDKNQPVTRYYRSGTEMLRMANVYLREGNHENAFILYLRYMTLFIEKIRQHPDYGNVKAEVRDINKRIKDEIMPTTEKLRAKLLAHYQREYEQFLANKEAERVKELERERERERQRQRELASRQAVGSSVIPSLIPANLHVLIDDGTQPSAPDLDLLDQVVYPNDFPTGANRTNLPGSGLLLPTGDASSDKTCQHWFLYTHAPLWTGLYRPVPASGFHPHPNDPPLFMEAQHIQKDAHTKIKVIDLRR
ncbi:GL14046 [Drosophila persimilis]|uniref:GL14046 n=1 Tax=Drosophila persimilis TaxID=7234 RepID=B4GNM2_DROPE|nr:GL14046 [Drosophila persimilis]